MNLNNPVIIFILAFYIACTAFYIIANGLILLSKAPAKVHQLVLLYCYPVDTREYLV